MTQPDPHRQPPLLGRTTQVLSKALLERGALSGAQLEQALAGRREGESLAQALLRLGLTDPREVARGLAELSGLPVADLTGLDPAPELLRLVPARLAYRARVLPLSRENGSLRVATDDPFRVEALDELRLVTGLDVLPSLAAADALEEALARLYGVGADALDRAADEGVARHTAAGAEESDLEAKDDAALIQFVNRLLLDAVAARASDIHIEPTTRELMVRYRIDGVLQPAQLPRELKRFQAAIASRIKIMANLDIAEKRLPQDGRIRIKSGGRELDVRVSVIPTIHGEGLALRLLDQGGSAALTLEELGFSPQHKATFCKMLDVPHGIVLVTGPTGSGKSTTLYAGLREIDRMTMKVITVEDPVEYRLDGVMQIQVKDKIGLTFARGLRHILRHDPDVVMIGEVRDKETAEIAVQAALTGHLVPSTLHTNDAAGAVTRLVDMGVEPFLVAATIEGLEAQRLLRRTCKHCAREVPVETAEERIVLEELGLAEVQRLVRGAGCALCGGRGFLGRTSVFELLPVDDGLRELASQGASAVRLRAYARERGYPNLRQDGCRLVRAGVTTPEEVARVTHAE